MLGTAGYTIPPGYGILGLLKSEEFPGGCIEGATPVPIPNTEVKPFGADGTAWVTVWESRKLPGLIPKARRASQNAPGFSLIFSSQSHHRINPQNSARRTPQSTVPATVNGSDRQQVSP